jgi:hypothetical protein
LFQFGFAMTPALSAEPISVALLPAKSIPMAPGSASVPVATVNALVVADAINVLLAVRATRELGAAAGKSPYTRTRPSIVGMYTLPFATTG